MKLTFLFAGVIALASNTAFAETMIKFGGSARVRCQADDKNDMASNRKYTLMRVRPNVGFEPHADVQLFFEPQFVKAFGDPIYYPTSGTANTFTNTSANGGIGADHALQVHQAYIDYHPFTFGRIILGRQILSYGDDLVIGRLDWLNTGRSFDAARVKFSYEHGFTDVFASKVEDNNSNSYTAQPTAGDRDFFGVYSNYGFGDYLKALDVYLLDLRDATARISAISADKITTSNLVTAGARVASNFSGFDYRAEATGQWTYYEKIGGQRGNARQFDVELGYTAEALAKTRIGLEWLTASKDYNQLYPTAHKFLGYADLLGRRNITSYVFHSSTAPFEGFKASFDYHIFKRVETDAPMYKTSGAAFGSGARSASSKVGTEFDIVLSYKLNTALTLSGGYGQFNSQDYFYDNYGIARADFYYASLDMTF